MIITGCEERRSLTKQPVKAEPKHPAIEGKRTLKVRDLQMDVPTRTRGSIGSLLVTMAADTIRPFIFSLPRSAPSRTAGDCEE